MNYVILDLEWNQPAGRANMVTSPVMLYGEVIRIGAVRLDEALGETGRHHGCVIPKYYKTMNTSVGRVTGLQSRAMTYGMKFPAAFDLFMKWCGEDFVILTWGEEDEKILRSNLELHGMDKGRLPRFYDLQVIFDRLIVGTSRQYGIAAALEYYGLPSDLKAHDALNDAIYTSRIGIKMDFPKFLPGYDELTEKIEREKAERAERNVKVFENVPGGTEVFTGKKYILCRCPGCKKIMRRGAFYFDTPDSIVTKAVCTADGEYMVRVERRNADDGTYQVTRSVIRMNDDLREVCRRAEAEGRRPAAGETGEL